MYHYLECGLNNVWLSNGYRSIKTSYGPALSIEDVSGLHRAIALTICSKAGRITGPEVRFVRRELDMSQAALGDALGVSSQTVALWEKSKAKVPGPADKLLRVLVYGHFDGNARVRRIVESFKRRDENDGRTKLVFTEKEDHWQQAA